MDRSVLPLIQHYGVPLVALLVFAGELGVPTGVPVEVALLLAGGYALHSVPGLLVGIVLVSVADLLGTTALHLVARTGGVRLLGRFLPRHEANQDGLMERWRRRVGGHDAAAVFVLRLLPLVRMWATVSTGLLQIRVRDFLLGAAPAALVWAGSPLVLGYVVRSDVHRLAERYTRFSHLFLVALPMIGLVGAVAWWTRRGRSLRAQWRRARSALGLVATVASVVYLIKVAWLNERATDRGIVALPYPVLILWLAIIGGFALVLLGLAFADLRTARRTQIAHLPLPRVVKGELATTLVWVSLVAVVGAIVTAIELRYPMV